MIRNKTMLEELNFISEVLDLESPMSEDSKQLFLDKLERVERKKGDELFTSKKEINRLCIVVKGSFKSYIINNSGTEEVLSFGLEGDVCLQFSSYMNKPYYLSKFDFNERFVLYEDSVLYYADIPFVKSLYETNLEWANWGRCFAENYVVFLSYFVDSLRYLKARERYCLILEKVPTLINRIPLQDIASCLGITPVSLSRIRAEI